MISRKWIKYCLVSLMGLVFLYFVIFEARLDRYKPVFSAITSDPKNSILSQTMKSVIQAQFRNGTNSSSKAETTTVSSNRTQPFIPQLTNFAALAKALISEVYLRNSTRTPTSVNVSMTPLRDGTASFPLVNRNASIFVQTQTRANVTQKQLVFEARAQVLSNGSRPVACDQCFNTDFPVLLQPDGVCNTGDGVDTIDVIMLLLTTHKAKDRRQAIRDTWASVTHDNKANIRHVFLLARSKVQKDMQSVQEEHARHGDIVMHDFVDSYSNLTLKTMSGLRWAVKNCGHARFILKADDDMWVNVPALMKTLNREEETLQTAVGGACNLNAKPIRNRSSKWYASFKAYPQKAYPGFCSGTSYVTSLNVARHVISVSPNVPFFYLEDVYLALCIQRLGGSFHLQRLKGFFHGGGAPCVLKSDHTITVHQVSPHKLREIWNAKCDTITRTTNL